MRPELGPGLRVDRHTKFNSSWPLSRIGCRAREQRAGPPAGVIQGYAYGPSAFEVGRFTASSARTPGTSGWRVGPGLRCRRAVGAGEGGIRCALSIGAVLSFRAVLSPEIWAFK